MGLRRLLEPYHVEREGNVVNIDYNPFPGYLSAAVGAFIGYAISEGDGFFTNSIFGTQIGLLAPYAGSFPFYLRKSLRLIEGIRGSNEIYNSQFSEPFVLKKPILDIVQDDETFQLRRNSSDL